MKKWVVGIVLVLLVSALSVGKVKAGGGTTITTTTNPDGSTSITFIYSNTQTDSNGVSTTVTGSSTFNMSSGALDGGVSIDASGNVVDVGAGGASAASIDAAVVAVRAEDVDAGSSIPAGTTGAHYGNGEISGFYRWPPDSGNYYPIQVGTVTGGGGVDSITLIPAYCPTEDMVADFDGELEFNGCCRWRPNGTVRVCHEGSRVSKGTCSYDGFLASEKVAKYCKVVCPPGTVYTPKYGSPPANYGECVGSKAANTVFRKYTKRCGSDDQNYYFNISYCVTPDECNSVSGMALGACGTGKVVCKPPTCMTESACKYQNYGTISYPDIGAIVGAQCGTVSAPKVMCIKPDAGYTCESCSAVAPSAPSCGSVDVVGNNVTLNWGAAATFGKACGIGAQVNKYQVYFGLSGGNMGALGGQLLSDVTSKSFVNSTGFSDFYWRVEATNGNQSTSSEVCPYGATAKVGWWQTMGAGIYSGGNITSTLPSASTQLIESDLLGTVGALLRANGSVNTGSGIISTPGWSAKTKYKGKKMDYSFFAAHMGVVRNE